jgi:hypothetical protein
MFRTIGNKQLMMVSRISTFMRICLSRIPDSQLSSIQQDAAVGNGTGLFLFVRTILVTPEISEFKSSFV